MSKHKLQLSTLEAHLWESANILRGPVDAADFKTYNVVFAELGRLVLEIDAGVRNIPEQFQLEGEAGGNWLVVVSRRSLQRELT